MAHPKLGTFTAAQQLDAQQRNDGRTDYEWQSPCGLLVLLRTGEGFMIACGGFYDPWFGSLQEAIDYLEGLCEEED